MSDRRPSTKRTPKQRVLKKRPDALCYNRGMDGTGRNWFQVWGRPVANGGDLLGMARSASGAWEEAAAKLHV